jgi:hypothetical protein
MLFAMLTRQTTPKRTHQKHEKLEHFSLLEAIWDGSGETVADPALGAALLADRFF